MRMQDDEGGATVLAAMAMSALIAVVVMVVHVGSAVGARHQAQSAADLAALAGGRGPGPWGGRCVRDGAISGEQDVD